MKLTHQVMQMNQNKKELDLTDDAVYYGKEANWRYLSVSQYKDFRRCEARALAKLKGDWEEFSNPQALLVGNFVHSYFESPEAHEKFLDENSSNLYKKDGNLYKCFEVANDMISRIKREPLFNYLWDGQRESVITGELFGVEWKGKIDLLNLDKNYFVDLKTTAFLDKRFWDDDYKQYVSFIEAYGYVLQLAVYEQLLLSKHNQDITGYIYAVTKQDPPDVAAIDVLKDKKEFELKLLQENIERVENVKNGQEKPKGCGSCEYCRLHKELEGFILSDHLIN